ncbi:MAG: sugar phosphate isomerase/epimerase [Desulfomonile tiedjei]|nr:sugar phosphate isomerase/epimerase [Desulfomonile tiedjei]
MDKSQHSYLRMGIVHFMAFPELAGGQGPWEETVKHIAKDPFFSAIEITHIADEEQRRKVRELCRLANLDIGFGAQPAILSQGLDLNSLDEGLRNHAVSKLKELLDEARFMGAQSFVVLSGKDSGSDKRADAVQALVKSLGELCAYSRDQKGPKIVAEVFDCDVDKCCLMGPAPLAREVAEAVCRDHDNFGLLVDLGHIPLLRETPRQALGPVKEFLAAAHLGNAVLKKGLPCYGDYHPIFGTPGSANDVPEMVDFLRTLVEIGFLDGQKRPLVSFEVKPMEGQDPFLVIANAKRVMEQAWAQV